MKTILLRVPQNPTRYEIDRALANYEESTRPYIPMELPSLSYPNSKLKGASLKAFYYQIKGYLP